MLVEFCETPAALARSAWLRRGPHGFDQTTACFTSSVKKYTSGVDTKTALATATIPRVLRQSISRWTPRCARATLSPPPTGSPPIPAYGSATTRSRISRRGRLIRAWGRKCAPG
jgi:hypothetical protein